MEKQYLDYEGLERFKGKLHEGSNIFPGTLEEWEALTEEEQAKYDFVASPDEATGDVADAVTDGDVRPVTSNAVFNAIGDKLHVATVEISTGTSVTNYGWLINDPYPSGTFLGGFVMARGGTTSDNIYGNVDGPSSNNTIKGTISSKTSQSLSGTVVLLYLKP